MSLMGIDIGSSTCKAAVFSETGAILSTGEASYKVSREEPGRFELDCSAVEQAIYAAIRQAADTSRWDPQQRQDPIRAVSVGSFGEAVVPLDRRGRILGPSIFSHDERRKDAVERLEALGKREFHRINGNILGYSYTYPKLVWYREDAPRLHEQIWKVLSWADFLVYRLTGSAATNYSHASRTLLFDLRRARWSDELLDAGGIDGRILADVVPSGTVMGSVLPDIAASLGLGSGVAVAVGGHDQCLNALGAGAVAGGDSVTGIGTVECTTVVFDSIPDLQTLFALDLGIEHHVLPGKYVTFLYNQAGSLQTWFIRAFAGEWVAEGLPERQILERLTDEAPRTAGSAVFLPFIEPSGAPLFLPAARGAFLGIGATTARGELYRALLEGQTLFFLEAFERLEQQGIVIRDILATGGGSRSDLWLQIKADLLRRVVRRARYRESGTVGAAILAGLATGTYGNVDEALRAFQGMEKRFEPDIAQTPAYAVMQRRYQQALGLLHCDAWS